MFTLRKSLACFVIAAAAISARSAFAEDKVEKPEVFFRAATILERVDQLSKTGGFTAPPIDAICLDVESRYSFLGPGAIVRNRPIGVTGILVKTDPAAGFEEIITQSGAFIVPVTEESAKFDALESYGKTADSEAVAKEKEKTVLGKNIALKRLKDHVAWSEGPAAAYVAENPFENDFKKPNVIGVASLNLAVMRKNAPHIEEKLVELITKSAGRDEAYASLTIGLIRPIVDSFNTISVVGTHADDVLTYTALVEPAAVKPPAAFDRPVFVEPQFIELHIVWPSEKIANWIPANLEKIDLAQFIPPAVLDDETAAAAKQTAARAAKLFLGDGAFSVGAVLNGRSAPTIHTVTQFASDVDVAKEVNEIAAAVKTIAKKQKLPAPIDVSEIAAGKQKIIRVTILNHDEPVFYIDLAQSGRKLAATFSKEKFDDKAATLLAIAAKEKNSSFIDANIDILPFLQIAMGDFLPAHLFAKIKTGVGDARYSLIARSDDAGKSMVVEIKQPLIIAREMEKAMREAFGREDPIMPVEPIPEPMPLDIRE
jgi:hypothetical protein